MTYTLYKITESQGKGCLEDESESWTNTISYQLIDEKDAESFGEWCADNYGNQDYSWEFSCVKIATFYSLEEANNAAKVIISTTKAIEDKIITEVMQETFLYDLYTEVSQ